MTAEEARAHLEEDILVNLTTLKFLDLYADCPDIRLAGIEDSRGWATVAVFPASLFSYDREHYPLARWIAFTNGTSFPLRQALLADLPRTFGVVKTNSAELPSAPGFTVRPGHAFTSWVPPRGWSLPALPGDGLAVVQGNSLEESVLELFLLNGYSREDIVTRLGKGAVWFAVYQDSHAVAGCLAYHNFGGIWEIAGVHTLSGYRGQGHGRRVVAAAADHLSRSGKPFRYHVDDENIASIALVKGLGLLPAMRIRHHVFEPVP